MSSFVFHQIQASPIYYSLPPDEAIQYVPMAKCEEHAQQFEIKPNVDMRPTHPHLVYLDLNKWIDLAHAEAGTKTGKPYGTALKTAFELVANRQAIFPLSFAHLMEVAKIGSNAQRRSLARLMVTLSQGWFLSSASSLIVAELRRAVALYFKKTIDLPTINPLTRNLTEAFIDPKHKAMIFGNLDDSRFQSPLVLEEYIATARISRSFLGNWQTFADNHELGRALLCDSRREVQKRAYCAVLTLGIQDRLSSVLSEFGLTMNILEDLGADGCMTLLESVPLLDVEINLHVERNQHKDRKIAANDEIDLGFLSLAVPYCNTVITEKFWSTLIHRLKLDQKYGTLVSHDLNDAFH